MYHFNFEGSKVILDVIELILLVELTLFEDRIRNFCFIQTI